MLGTVAPSHAQGAAVLQRDPKLWALQEAAHLGDVAVLLHYPQ